MKSAPPPASDAAGHVGQPLLEIAVGRAHDDEAGEPPLERRRDRDLPRHADQRVLRRLIAVGGREERGALDVRVVVRAARGQVDEAHAQRLEQGEQARGLVEVRPQRIVADRRRRRTRRGAAPRPLRPRRPAPSWKGRVSKIDTRTPMARPGTRARIPATTSRRKRVRFSKAAAVGAGARVRAQELVPEVAVAVLDVHEPEARLAARARRRRRSARTRRATPASSSTGWSGRDAQPAGRAADGDRG